MAAQLGFFRRHQKEGESLRDFSHVLKSLLDVVIKKTPGGVLNSDRVLRDQFAENVNDEILRRELKRQLALDPDMSFLTLHGVAIKWMEEGRQVIKSRHRAFSCDTHVSAGVGQVADSTAIAVASNEMAEIKECLRRQQRQLHLILSQLNASRPQVSQRGVGANSKSYQFQHDGKPICRRCNQAGHIAKYCTMDLGPTSGAIQGLGQRATTCSQLGELSAPLLPQEN